MNTPLLRMENISKSFPGVRALDGVSLTVRSGTVHALMGENGAGKSTLMKCLFGVYSKDSGRILLDGEEVSFSSSADALRHGVAMVHQELNQALKLTVAENMWLGRFPKYKDCLPFVNERRMRERTKEVFLELGIDISPDEKTERLPPSARQMAEIAKAVSYGARIIVFDEPTSSLGNEEAERLFEIIRKLRDTGCGIIYISHKMEEILRISDEVTVMRDGRHVATKEAKGISTSEIIRLMVGRELSARYPERERVIGEELLSVKGLKGEYSALRDVSFSLRSGEVLGIAGLDGSGRTEVLDALFGRATRSSGEIYLRGRRIQNRTPREAIASGFAYVTEERRRSGIFGILSVEANTVISSLKNYRRALLLSEKRTENAAKNEMRRLRVKAPNEKTKISTLSGGNQQKVIFSRWMLTKPTVLLLDEPTRGIDVLAKYEIYEIIGELARSGRGVIMVSSEMPELLGVCDRILVMSGGRLAGELTPDASQEQIMELATRYV